MKTIESTCLKHHFLLAMPNMDDEHFAQTLIYMIEHGPEGSMGLIVNRPSRLSLADILEQLQPDLEIPPDSDRHTIYAGGPVQTERGFVLHPAGPIFQATLQLGDLALSTSQDTLISIAKGEGPAAHIIALGYSGWTAGQLEAELADNCWLTCPASASLLFETPPEQRLQAAAASIGVDLNLLSTQAGHA